MFSDPFTQCLPRSLLLASIAVSLSPLGVRADDTGADTPALASVRRVPAEVDAQHAWPWTQAPPRACGPDGAEACAAPVCGNGVVEHGETCDDGNTMNGDGCSEGCRAEVAGAPVCGNRVTERGEACDDGNLVNGDGCSVTCELDGPVAEMRGAVDGDGCGSGDAESGGLWLCAAFGVYVLGGRRWVGRRS